MTFIRLALLLFNAAAFLVLGALFLEHPPVGEDVLVVYGLLLLMAANCVYIILATPLVLQPNRYKWRVFRILKLWFDAKESELQARVQRAQRKSD